MTILIVSRKSDPIVLLYSCSHPDSTYQGAVASIQHPEANMELFKHWEPQELFPPRNPNFSAFSRHSIIQYIRHMLHGNQLLMCVHICVWRGCSMVLCICVCVWPAYVCIHVHMRIDTVSVLVEARGQHQESFSVIWYFILISLLDTFISFYVWLFCLKVCALMCMLGVLGSLKVTLATQELELEFWRMNYHAGAGTWT